MASNIWFCPCGLGFRMSSIRTTEKYSVVALLISAWLRSATREFQLRPRIVEPGAVHVFNLPCAFPHPPVHQSNTDF